MRTQYSAAVAVFVVLGGGVSRGLPELAHALGGQQAPAPTGSPEVNESRSSKAELEQWMKKYSNWGRWGKDDEIGTLNLITPAKRKQALALAKTGTAVSLSHEALLEKSNEGGEPLKQTFNVGSGLVATERQEVNYHGSLFTHYDALCHYSYEGTLYNGFKFTEVVTPAGGCLKMGTPAALNAGIITRGVLIDMPALRGVPYLQNDTHVYREDIDAWEKKTGVKVGPGDALLLRVGRWGRRAKEGPVPQIHFPAFDASVAPFLKERDVALIGSDGVNDVGLVPGFRLPIHQFAMVALGAHILDNADLDELAETAAKLKRWEFLFIVTPQRVKNGTGSWVNPIAVF